MLIAYTDMDSVYMGARCAINAATGAPCRAADACMHLQPCQTDKLSEAQHAQGSTALAAKPRTLPL